MKRIRSTCVAMVVAVMLGLSVYGAPITWQTPVTTIANSDAQVSKTYSYRWAYTGGSAATVNTVAFSAGLNQSINNANIQVAGFTGASTTAFNGGTSGTWNTLSTGYKAILTGAVYGQTPPATVTLKNLVVGGHYLVQIWVNDSRSLAAARTMDVTSSGGNSVTLDFNDSGALGGVGQFAIGTFTADAATQTFTITGNVSCQLNAIQLREEGNSLVWDAEASPDVNWITANNWDPDKAPVAGDSVTFTNTGLKASGTISCQLPSSTDTTCYDLSISGTASYGSNWHTLDLGGKTLTLRGNMSVGNPGVNYTHNSRMTNGNLVVNGTTMTLIRPAAATDNGGTHTIDWSGLTSLTALNLTTLAIASENDRRFGAGTLVLAGVSNILKATTCSFGWGNTGTYALTETLNMNGSTLFYADTLDMAGGYKTGIVKMQFGGLGAETVVLRNKAGTGRMNVNLSYRAYGGTSTRTTGIMDFSGGTVDALLGVLTLSKNTDHATRAGYSDAQFIMGNSPSDASSVVDVTSVSLSPTALTGTGDLQSNPTLDIRGGIFRFGSFTVTAFAADKGARKLLLKGGTFSASGAAAQTIPNLTLLQFGDTAPRTVTLGEVGKGALTFSATLMSLSDAATLNTVVGTTLNNTLSGEGSLTKSGDATLTLKGASASYTGATTLAGGRLVIAATNALPSGTAVTLTSGTLQMTNAVTQAISSLTGTAEGVLELPYDCDGALTISASVSGVVKISVYGVPSWSGLDNHTVYPLVQLGGAGVMTEGTILEGVNIPYPWKIVQKEQNIVLQYMLGTMIRFL